MKSVIMIAYGFPPEGNAGAYRPLRFARQLSSFGWKPTVVTVDTEFYERFDPTLLALVPSDVEVIRVRNRDPWQTFQGMRGRRFKERISQASPRIADRIQTVQYASVRSFLREAVLTVEAWSYHPDLAMGWIRPAVKKTLKICANKRPDMIWATAGPLSSFIVAQRVAYKTGIPYVLDFRDAWTLTYNEFENRQPKWAQRSAYRSMYRLLKDAHAVVFRYETEAECFWRAYPGALDVDRIRVIPNGFDGDVEPFQETVSTGKCRILYAGTLADYRYDTFLSALRLLKKESPQLAKCLDIHFVGEDNQQLRERAATLDVGCMVKTSEAVGFNEVTQMSKDAHTLLVLGRCPTMTGYELFAPAKLFGYLKLGRPILGVLPEDEAKKLLQRIGVSTVANVDSVPEIATVLRQLIIAWNAGRLASLVPSADKCREYSASHQTRLLINALAGKAAEIPFDPGRETIPPSLREVIQRRSLETERFDYRRLQPGAATH